MPVYDCSDCDSLEEIEEGLEATVGLAGVDDGVLRAAEACCESGLGWFTELESLRGLGGGGGLGEGGV
tara:strand:- start:10463 stop:10666 length:204 start_codon:yes stop_codon:yes gene_type:complete